MKAAGYHAEKAGMPQTKVRQAEKAAASKAAEEVKERTGFKAREDATDSGDCALRSLRFVSHCASIRRSENPASWLHFYRPPRNVSRQDQSRVVQVLLFIRRRSCSRITLLSAPLPWCALPHVI